MTASGARRRAVLCGEDPLNRARNQAILLSAERDVWELEALLDRIRAGDADAVSELEQAYGAGVRYFLRRTYAPADPEEAFQRVWEVLLDLLRRGASAQPLAVLVRQAAHTCGLKIPPRPPATAPGSLRAALRDCSARERAFLERCYLQGEDPAAVARDLKLSPAEVAALYQKVGRPGNAHKTRRAAAG